MRETRAAARWRWGDLGRMLVTWASATVALAVAGALLPGLDARTPWSWVAAAAVAGLAGALLRPALVWAAALIGWVGILLVALAGQAVVIQAAIWVVPGIAEVSFWTALAAAWTSALLGTLIGWVVTAGTPESLVATLTSRGRRARTTPAIDDGLSGMLFVQLDGVPAPTLRWALEAGLMPTVRRWVDDTHRLREWTVQLPCTTPASQLGILHGRHDVVPGFRWYDRELGRVLVANRAADARIIEARVSDGRGLLADDGTSVSNLFSGDAERCSMVFSRVELTRGRFETRRAMAWFFARPDGFARSLGRAIAEMTRERFQARQQRVRDVRPRVRRPWQFTGLRAGTNGLLRDVNLAVVARELMAGRRAVYVDFVDYDEVAHHAGPMRLESLAVLAELDQVVAVLEQVAAVAPRHYEIVLLSDHGQSLGTPFAQAHGEDLAAVCRRLMDTPVAWEGEPVESWGRVASMAEDAAGTDSISGRAAGSVARRLDRRTATDAGEAGATTDAGEAGATGDVGQAGAGAPADEVVVLGSGSLGLLYGGGPVRLSLPDIERRWPELVAGLRAHPGIELLAGVDDDGAAVVLGRRGSRRLDDDALVGDDPLARLPDHAARVLGEALAGPAAPDLYLLGAVDADTGEVAAFEELVGSHGGLGGWQDRAMLVAPSTLLPDQDTPIHGAVALHRLLVGMLVALGHRTGLGEEETA